jgi:hypothetical protein
MSDTTTTPSTEEKIQESPSTVETTETKPTDKEYNFRALEKAKLELEKENKALKASQQAKLEAELAEKGEFKKLAETKAQEAETLKKELETYKFESQLQTEVLKSGVNPKYLKYLQAEVKESVKLNENGEIENLTETLTRLKTEYSEWFTPNTPSFGSDKTTSPTSTIALDKIADLSPSDYKANRDKILATMRGE